MASGTFERPLPDPAEEKALLGLSGLKCLSFDQDGNTTRYFSFAAEPKDGLLILSAGAAQAGKRGMYIFGSTSSGAISLTPILAPAQSAVEATAAGNTIRIANGSSHVYVLILQYVGRLPSVTAVQPA
jgi:hypothetical protein